MSNWWKSKEGTIDAEFCYCKVDLETILLRNEPHNYAVETLMKVVGVCTFVVQILTSHHIEFCDYEVDL